MGPRGGSRGSRRQPQGSTSNALLNAGRSRLRLVGLLSHSPGGLVERRERASRARGAPHSGPDRFIAAIYRQPAERPMSSATDGGTAATAQDPAEDKGPEFPRLPAAAQWALIAARLGTCLVNDVREAIEHGPPAYGPGDLDLGGRAFFGWFVSASADPTCPGFGGSADRPADGAVGIDDLTRAAAQCRHTRRRVGLSGHYRAVAC